jgi:hypothetical protein
VAKKVKSAMADAYTFTVGDYKVNTVVEELLLLGLSHQSEESAHQRTEWAYKNNPAGPAIVCIMRHKESHKDVGLVTVCKRQVWSRNGLAETGIFCDLVIDISHRTLGPALKLMERALIGADEAKLDRTCGWPSERSKALFSRLPQSQVGKIDVYRRYFDWSDEFYSRLPKPLACFVGYIAGLVDSCIYGVKKLIRSKLFTIQHLDEFTPAFDELWSVARARYDEIGVRDASFLTWRFTDNPEQCHKIFAMYSKSGNRLAGYVVYREHKEGTIEISDFLASHSDFSERNLLDSFCTNWRDRGHKKISLLYSGNPNTVRNLWWCGFIHVGSRVCNFRQPDGSKLPVGTAVTHVTQADQDVG